eukprot:CAMPEP_0174343432 /NCGR_PEP_ID=MMETSP0810-20121108/26952_1 /TAXON_ID=73025 ORGANISM="Eutreptiella gymnastica-like, Strain CCMP1594" /NCGR_SAMPLE_ID=MMETSP0810 /ASSEMBLY_ACC=CAM_ASM_000659 /LENGTH=147 /DNA_ID=CAMNT_0015466155 /DNA_START=14 /DNA_END=456 /DNA_ORIENTATION=+
MALRPDLSRVRQGELRNSGTQCTTQAVRISVIMSEFVDAVARLAATLCGKQRHARAEVMPHPPRLRHDPGPRAQASSLADRILRHQPSVAGGNVFRLTSPESRNAPCVPMSTTGEARAGPMGGSGGVGGVVLTDRVGQLLEAVCRRP